jgi:hypothetical protein
MKTWQLAVLLRPLGSLILFGCIALPGRILVQKYMKDGKLKRFLLMRIHNRW